ncbi:ROK family protein [Cryobacterium roopkundense]|uniref:Putative NBD/HSP70 family sugar kinase n=1 Tax=Cryobacterium roopkundense TaxID=1001240 RepID=A0A7W8ZYR8_9MICO|nr:putative NBD/HSP70 family sugar kinase [Cryobacterium roopkundense]
MQGNNHDDVRRHNLSIILRAVHRGGPSSRADLTRLTGLNRSTISALVAELVQLGLVGERQPDATRQVGRPSPVVEASGRVAALAVHPEIDAVTVGLVGLDGVVHRRIRSVVEHSPSAAEAVSLAAAVIEGLRGDLELFDVVGVGVAVPGLVRTVDGVVRHAPHLGWVDEPFAERLADATGYPVVAANDASLGVLAERYFGAGRGLTDLVYLNGGASGIGGGLIVGGRVVGGHAGYAGEFGHTRVSESQALDSAGFRGTLEAEVTRRGLLEALAGDSGGADESGFGLGGLDRLDGLGDLDSRDGRRQGGLGGSGESDEGDDERFGAFGIEAADADELERALLASTSPRVRAEVNRQIDYLAVALASAINVLNPQLVVLGGFLAALRAVDPERLQAAVAELTLRELLADVHIDSARLGSDLPMIGAAELAFDEVLGNPQAFVRGSRP